MLQILYNLAVCEGYAKAFSALCYKAGIQTEYVIGRGNNSSHGWNLVRVDGVWYQIDVTWDSNNTTVRNNEANIYYKYFLLPDNVMEEDHTAQTYTNYHSCDDSRYIAWNALYQKTKR